MALPKDQLNAVDRSIIDNLNAQSENIKNQSKILHKLSDEILNQRRQFSSNKSSNAQMQKEMFKLGSGISDIKNYLMGASKSKSTVGDPKNQGTDRRFFTNLFTKVFGPSRYQLQMLDELSSIRSLAERQSRSLDYIAENIGNIRREGNKETLPNIQDGGDGDSGGGILGKIFKGALSGFGKILLAGLVGAVSLLSAGLTNSIRQVFNVISEMWGSLKELVSFLKKLFPFGTGGGIPAGGVPGGSNRPGGVVGVPPMGQSEPGRSGGGMSPNDPNKRLSGPNQRLLAPPNQRGAPFDPNYNSRFPWNEGKYGPRVMDAENVRSSGAGRFPRFTPGGRGAIYGFLASLGLAGYLGTQEGEMFADDGLDDALKNPEIEKIKAEKSKYVTKEQEFVDKITSKGFKDSDLINDPENPTGLITIRQLKQRLRNKLATEEEKKKFDEDLRIVEEKRLDALEKELKWIEEGTSNQKDFNKILENTAEQLDKFGDFLQENFKFDSKKFIDFLNELGAIQIQGQKINLLPGLGDASQKTLADTIKLSEELGDYVKEKVMPPTIINNNSGNVIDNSTKGQSSGGFPSFRIAPTDQDILNRLKMSK